jgi:site-specific DNA-cytosine methylase
MLDMFDREQYVAFHGHEPPPDWREATPDDIRKAAHGERPHIVFLSAPCKGLLSESRSRSDKYQALNRLTLRGIWLMLEAWYDDPPELIIFENVPRIQTRGRALLDRIGELLHSYGYAVAETTHDCGEIGGLAQSRKRFLMVARHVAKVPAFLYEPPKRPLRAVGEILEKLPLPGDPLGGPMHSIPRLQWKTWVRLAFVEAGSDWRSLNKLRVVDGKLADYLIVPESHNDRLGVNRWDEPSGTITGDARPDKGAFSVADPRFDGAEFGQFGVRRWEEPTGVVTSQRSPGQGYFSVADPRLKTSENARQNIYRIIAYDEVAKAITGASHVAGGAACVADPRFHNPQGKHSGKYSVQRWDGPTSTITGSDRVGSGALCIADPRIELQRSDPYGVVRWEDPSGAVTGVAKHDNGRFTVADPRIDQLPAPNDKLVAIIRALDGTWHRPFTTLELAALQSLIDPDDIFDLDGNSDSAKRERIGNAVPPQAAQAIADLMGQTLLLSWSGHSFQLSATPIWVRPIAIALSVKTM